jgi:hypothetical protein
MPVGYHRDVSAALLAHGPLGWSAPIGYVGQIAERAAELCEKMRSGELTISNRQ